MERPSQPLRRRAILLLLCLQAGCGGLPRETSVRILAGASERETRVQPAAARATPRLPVPTENHFPVGELSADAVVQQVLARNPTLTQMVAAWQAAVARYPQVTSLDDPIAGVTIGPGTIRPDDRAVEFASRWEISQRYPWPGKLGLRGANALAESSAAGNDVEAVRLQLVESARSAVADYYLATRALEVNEESLRLLREFRQNAETRYRTGLVPQQDLLQADVEIGRQEERGLLLERLRQVAIARLNTLMNLPPEQPLPPAPREVQVESALAEPAALQALAHSRRPDLRALNDRLAAAQASLALACKEFYPDLEPFVMYDRFMGNTSQSRDLAAMVGVKMNLPVRQARRQGAVAEAQARVAQRRAELAKQTSQVGFEVQEAYEQVREGQRVVSLYETKILPAAQANVTAAQSAYVTGKIPFLSLIEAQRSLVALRDRYYEALADYVRRHVALERAIGGPLAEVDGRLGHALP